jgi:ATP-dependent RNA helicase SUPV3L1/SUV3
MAHRRFDFSSLDALKQLDAARPVQGLTKALPAASTSRRSSISRAIPTFRSLPRRASEWKSCGSLRAARLPPHHLAQHSDMVGVDLQGSSCGAAHVDENFMSEQVRRADRTDGDIDTLSRASRRSGLGPMCPTGPAGLPIRHTGRKKTREIEDGLSDALHERLTKRFVDRRTSVLMKRLRENAMLEAEISVNGDVFVEGHHVGQLSGFPVHADQSAARKGQTPRRSRMRPRRRRWRWNSRPARAKNARRRQQRSRAGERRHACAGSANRSARSRRPHHAKPRVILLLADEQLTGHARDMCRPASSAIVQSSDRDRAQAAGRSDAGGGPDQGIAKGLAFQLVENLGVLFRRDVADDVKALDQDGRASLRKYGIRFGAYHIFMPALLKPAPAELITLLWALKNDGSTSRATAT